MNIPSIVSRTGLKHTWAYRNHDGDPVALIARYESENGKSKKWYQQFRLEESGIWVEGVASPSPLFGLETLPKTNCPTSIYIFEGEKCAQGTLSRLISSHFNDGCIPS